ncbi:PLP-dependent aminotransferase family protein [Sedimentibacter sp. zth1]|uniref:MocR-like pyridoxine biosynthesis transcription factor PdxR n=1 Tax=Sedimentibacter sp. zth1 TaxID=2816908 RepID=UPI001A9399BB|nr:PLP-dependent aminotransferase family protein [Sedimentibacter sp. zth1]QSX05494.1 PLP-dependent aminotransferase family protein [Sedimentibacter sp. zth1]
MDKKINFTILLNKNSTVPIYIQLYEYIREQIVNNNFKASNKLPSIREAASILKISKTTIENAYNQLIVEGYIENISKKGYFINDIGNFNYSKDFNSFKSISSSNYNELVYDNNGIDDTSFNAELWKKLYNRVLTDKLTNIYTNGSPQGEYDLRYEISEFVNNIRGGRTTPEQVIIGAGIQYLLGILAGMIKHNYNSVSIESPGYKKAEYIFEDYMFKINHIPVNSDSFNIDCLKTLNSNLLYVSPSHQYPIGNVMPINKRLELLKWASNVNGLIIEDDYDGIIRYDGMPIPCLQGLDNNDCVIYLGSFSKTLLPSLRISYMIIPKKLIKSYENIKYKYTQSTSKIDQIVLSLFIKEGHITKHLRKIRRIYKKKNTALTSYFNDKYNNTVKIINSDSGFHIVVEVITCKKYQDILETCKKNNILVEIVDVFPNKMLLSINYSGIKIEQITSFVDKLMQSIS